LEGRTDAGQPGVLLLCTGNVCRSPMAATLLTNKLRTLGVAVPIRSAGLFPQGYPALPEVISAMAAYGFDLSGHRSRTVIADDLTDAALVVGMAREHVRHAVVTVPEAWPRAFTLKELIRRGEEIGPRTDGEPLGPWLARVHAGRERAWLLGQDPGDDVPDPAGGPPEGYAGTAALLDRLMTRLAKLCWGCRADTGDRAQ
jgi:protein-tyrosine-phosphatase